jgi:DNA-binding MarR family transcriptional regulator
MAWSTELLDGSDRRRRLVQLTPTGRRLLDTAKAKRRLLLRSLLSDLGPDDRAQVLRAANTIAEAAWRLLQRPIRLT